MACHSRVPAHRIALGSRAGFLHRVLRNHMKSSKWQASPVLPTPVELARPNYRRNPARFQNWRIVPWKPFRECDLKTQICLIRVVSIRSGIWAKLGLKELKQLNVPADIVRRIFFHGDS